MGSSSHKDRDIRNQIKKELSKNFSQALKTAENMSDPWYKTQTLTEVALHCKNRKQQLNILKQALASALQCRDQNRTVNVSCWPLETLYDLGFKKEFYNETSRLLMLILNDNFSISRGNALFNMCMATVKDPDVFLVVLGHFLNVCKYRYFWRFDRDCYWLTLAMKKHNYEPASIEMALSAIQKRRIRRKAERDLTLQHLIH